MESARPPDRVGCDPPAGWKRRLLTGAQQSLHRAGLTRVHAALAPRGAPVILMYHSVATGPAADWIAPRNRLTPAQFEGQMAELARHRQVVDLEALGDSSALRSGRGRPPVVLTFDDGYLDNLEVVAPILDRLQLPAILYLATGYVERGETQWADQLYGALRWRQSDRLEIGGRVFELSVADQRETAYWQLSAHLLEAGAAERTQILSNLREQLLGELESPRCTLRWDEVRQLLARHPGFRIGAHTREHLDLTALPLAEALGEIERSLADIEQQTGQRPVHFSFPYCRFNEELRGGLRELGIRSAMTGDGVAAGAPDPMDLPRLEAPPSAALFGYWTSGAHPRLSRLLFGRA